MPHFHQRPPGFCAHSQLSDTCRHHPPALRFSVRRGLDRVHLVSALTIATARGLNDTPKITTLLLTVDLIVPRAGIALIAAAMGLGGLNRLLLGRILLAWLVTLPLAAALAYAIRLLLGNGGG